MTVDDLRVVVTVLAFVAFVGIAFWAYSRRRRADFEEAARLPFDEAAGGRDADELGNGR